MNELAKTESVDAEGLLEESATLLKSLRDHVLINHLESVSRINSLLAKSAALTAPVVVEPPPPPKGVEKRHEPRDPGEYEQHVAESWGVTKE